MNEEQLKQTKELLKSFGFDVNEASQTLTNMDNKASGEIVLTFKARFSYTPKIKADE